MTEKASNARERIIMALDDQVANLTKEEYRDVLEDLEASIEGRLEAVEQELADEE